MDQHIIISPHCDDALLALGGTILQLPGKVSAITVFGTCAWTSFPETYPLEEITRINQEEDRRALSAAGCDLILYEYPEVLFRGYRKWNTKRLHASDKELVQQVGQTIRKHIVQGSSVYLPLAPGRHVDHALISGQLKSLFKEFSSQNVTFYLYEDLPYSWYGGLEEVLAIAKKDYILTPILRDVTMTFNKKISLLREYKTQLAQADLDKVTEYAQSLVPSGYGERVWQVTKK